MVPVNLSKEIIKMLQSIEGDTTEQKVINLVSGNVAMKVRECDEAIAKFEAKYGLVFADFKSAWEKGKIAGKYSHEVESDYSEWEAFEDEKRHWLSTSRKIKLSPPRKSN